MRRVGMEENAEVKLCERIAVQQDAEEWFSHSPTQSYSAAAFV